MKLQSSLSKKEYLRALKGRMESPFRFGLERFCGFHLGGLFYVTHHCSHEWNRKITGERNTAIGIVRKDGDGCKARYFVIKGLLAPHCLLGMFLFCLAICLVVLLQEDVDPATRIFTLPISIVFPLFAGLGTAVTEGMSERSEEGEKILRCMLLDPSDPFSFMNHHDKL
jgi:hypothetical protein